MPVPATLPTHGFPHLAAGWTIWEQKFHSGAVGPEWSQTFPERIAIAGRAIWSEPFKAFPDWDAIRAWASAVATKRWRSAG